MKQTFVKQLLTKELGKDYVLLRRLKGGMMNVSYVVQDKNGKKYIIYLPNGKANKVVERQNEKRIQKIVSDLNLTSKNIYFDTHTGIKINEFIEGTPLNQMDEFDPEKVSDLLHLLHDSKIMSENDYNPIQRLINYENQALKFQKESNTYRKIRDFLSAKMYQFEKRYEKVLCHNDAQKSNIVVNEDGEYKFIDFEFAANNDPIYDIAAFANDNVEDGELIMKYYFKKPTVQQIKRFYLWRILISLQWHVMAIIKHYQNESTQTKVNFLAVANHFIKNAALCMQRYQQIDLLDR